MVDAKSLKELGSITPHHEVDINLFMISLRS